MVGGGISNDGHADGQRQHPVRQLRLQWWRRHHQQPRHADGQRQHPVRQLRQLNGGGIFNDGTLTVSGSTLSGNSAGSMRRRHLQGKRHADGQRQHPVRQRRQQRRGGGWRHLQLGRHADGQRQHPVRQLRQRCGGGIYNGIYGTLTVSGSTLSANSAAYRGGGIANYSTADGRQLQHHHREHRPRWLWRRRLQPRRAVPGQQQHDRHPRWQPRRADLGGHDGKGSSHLAPAAVLHAGAGIGSAAEQKPNRPSLAGAIGLRAAGDSQISGNADPGRTNP